MVNVTCCGDQDRNTKASETHPNRPPNDTRNCYTRNSFDWNSCGTQNEKACLGKGGCDACVADSTGGYCDNNGSVFVAEGNQFVELKGTQLIDRFRNDNNIGRRNDIRLRRETAELERKMENKIREMQIMGQDPLLQRPQTIQQTTMKTPSSQSFVGSYIGYIGFSLGVLILFISFYLEYSTKNKLLA